MIQQPGIGAVSPINYDQDNSVNEKQFAEVQQSLIDQALIDQQQIRESASRTLAMIDEQASAARLSLANNEPDVMISKRFSSESKPVEKQLLMAQTSSQPQSAKRPQAVRILEKDLPCWYHGSLTMSDAKAKIESSGIKNGRFLIRKDGSGDFILSIGYKGHTKDFYIMEAEDRSGYLALHDTSGDIVGSYGNLIDMVAALSTEALPSGWNIMLTQAVDRNTGASKDIYQGVLGDVVATGPVPNAAMTDTYIKIGGSDEPPATDTQVSTEVTAPEPVHVSEPVRQPEPTVVQPVTSQRDAQESDDILAMLHGETTGKEGPFEQLRSSDGTFVDGTFLLERAGKPSNYVINVNYKGKPTRHLIEPQEDGVLVVNKRKYGDFTTIEALIGAFATEPLPPKWPVMLTNPVMPGSTATSPDEPPAPTPAPESPVPVVTSSSSKSWAIAPKQGSEKAAEQLKDPSTGAYEDGVFVVEKHSDAGTHVLNVVYKGRPTRHKLVAGADGIITANNRKFGTATTVEEFIDSLMTTPLPKGWPVVLTRSAFTGGDSTDDATPPRPTSRKPKVTTSRWVAQDHVPMDEGKQWAANLVGTSDNGTFIFRKHNPNNDVQLCLCLVYKNRMTQHSVVLDPVNGATTINKKNYGALKSVDDIVDALSQATLPVDETQKAWPVKLTAGYDCFTKSVVPVGGGGGGSSDQSTLSWHYPIKNGVELTRAQAESKLAENGEYPNGKFVVRDHSPGPGEWVISVNFKGKPTHHLAKMTDGVIEVNKKTFNQNWTTIEQVVQTLSLPNDERPAGWPIRLIV